MPRLWLFSDPERAPNPLPLMDRLPPGAGVVYRPFGAPDRAAIAADLAAACRAMRLSLLIGADPRLAQAVGANGVHWPSRLAHKIGGCRQARPDWWVTCAAHSWADLRRASTADAVFLSPIFPTRSASARPVIGLGRARSWLGGVHAPVIALGGVGLKHMAALAQAGFSGAAGVDWIRENTSESEG